MPIKRIIRGIVCYLVFVLCGLPRPASAKTDDLTAAQQRLVNYCVSVVNYQNGDYTSYTYAAQRKFAAMSRQELRRQLEPCLAVLTSKSRYGTRQTFAVSYILAYYGVNVHKNFSVMRKGGLAEEMFPLMENIYRRHPDDFILKEILWQRSDGAGTEALLTVYFYLFRDYPTSVLRVSRNLQDLEFLLKALREGRDWPGSTSIDSTLRRVTHSRDKKVALNAKYCLKHRRKAS